MDYELLNNDRRIKKLRPRGAQVKSVSISHDSDEDIQVDCQYCDYTTTKRHLLLRHLKKYHMVKRSFCCNICNRRFRTLLLLNHHKSTHSSNEKAFPCKYCDGSYKSIHNLNRHIRYKHTNERPHKCTECNYAFVERSKLARHMRCHTRNMRYPCSLCSFTSPNIVNLNQHKTIHNDPDYKPPHPRNEMYECNECGLAFYQKSELISHVMICDQIMHKRIIVKTEEEENPDSVSMQESHDSDNDSQASQLIAITNYLVQGEIILLPEGESYAMIKLIPDEDDMEWQDLGDTIDTKDSLELEQNKETDVESEQDEMQVDGINEVKDEEVEPFYGFDLKNIQLAVNNFAK